MEQPQASHPQDKPAGSKKDYPEPLVILPSTIHTHSIILLHGRGSNATRFGLEFLKSKTSTGQTLQELFPGAKFTFPTAKKRRSTALKRVPINQWFDKYSLEDPAQRLDLQYDGLRETSAFVHSLIRAEAKAVGLRNVILGGLSQGCAMSLHISLNYEPGDVERPSGVGEPQTLGGYIGMSGWLPFAKDISSAAVPSKEDRQDADDTDPFGSADGEDGEEEVDDSVRARQLRAANYVRDIVDLDPLDEDEQPMPSFARVPDFLGHGTADKKVWVRLGEQARDVLVQLGLDVTWKPYQEFGHRYKEPDEIDDIVQFLREMVGMKPTGLE
ncbi:hypothetical protein H2201_001013 [Coniosporium apollinis]|uniref:Acyl-protein thioesterase 1 n=1 Tax=Coniosporium apollinis TaxID=61459 RepID=A0ABQ9P7A6_9PEZI|nr:hypothetical protein H2201_001013 [Coniosporium apollinis]